MTRREYHNLVEPTRFSRSWWARRGRSLLWVALVTVLVWIYADVEFIDTKSLTVTIRLTVGKSRDLLIIEGNGGDARLVEERDVPVTFEVTGNRSSVEELLRGREEQPPVIRFDVSQNCLLGENLIQTERILQKELRISESGLELESVSKSVIKVQLSRPRKTLPAVLTLVLNKSPDLILLPMGHPQITFQIEGTADGLERFEAELMGRAWRLVCDVSGQVRQGENDLDTQTVLSAGGMAGADLTVLSASPPKIKVHVDRRVHQADIPVRLDYTGAVFSEVTIQPPKVGIHVAESDWEDIRNTDPNLRTVQVDLKQVASDKPFVVELVREIGGVPVEPDQPTVTVTVKIATLTETEKVTVPVQVVSPPEWLEDGTWREYALSRRDRLEWRVTIQVSGTRKDLDQLKGEDVRAYVVLTEDDKKPVSWLTRPVEVRLPRALNLSLLGPPPTVSFKLEKVPSGG